MSVRILPVAFMFCLALPAEARDARMAAPGADGTACTADYAGSTPPEADPARPARRPESEKPVISRGSNSDSDASRPPRWHSFLPGMFR